MLCNKKTKLGLCVLTSLLILTGYKGEAKEIKTEAVKAKTVIKYKEFNIPQHKFTDNVIKDAYAFQYDGFKITQPYKKSSKQTLTHKKVAEEFQKLPKVLKENMKEIQLLDYNNIEDKYWSDILDMKDFKSYAVGGYKQICFYANDYLSIKQNNSLVVSTLIHESAHNFDEAMSDVNDRYSNSEEWILTMSDDLDIKDNGYGLYCSKYAQDASSSLEDFAEAVTQYVMNKDKFAKEYPSRTNKINELFNK